MRIFCTFSLLKEIFCIFQILLCLFPRLNFDWYRVGLSHKNLSLNHPFITISSSLLIINRWYPINQYGNRHCLFYILMFLIVTKTRPTLWAARLWWTNLAFQQTYSPFYRPTSTTATIRHTYCRLYSGCIKWLILQSPTLFLRYFEWMFYYVTD